MADLKLKADGVIDELSSVLAQACGEDSSIALPADARELDLASITTWSAVRAVLAAYPQGVPLTSKNELIAICQRLTQSGDAVPDLSVAVVRMPVLGGHTTKQALRSIHAPGRKHSGLTRDSAGAGVRVAARGGSNGARSGKAGAAPKAPSVEQLKHLEGLALRLHGVVASEPASSPRLPHLRAQARQAFVTLEQALTARLDHVTASGGAAAAISGYRQAIDRVRALIEELSA